MQINSWHRKEETQYFNSHYIQPKVDVKQSLDFNTLWISPHIVMDHTTICVFPLDFSYYCMTLILIWLRQTVIAIDN